MVKNLNLAIRPCTHEQTKQRCYIDISDIVIIIKTRAKDTLPVINRINQHVLVNGLLFDHYKRCSKCR